MVASVTRIIDPALKSEQASYFSTITGAKKVDDLTVDITTNGPDPILPARMYWMKMIPAKYSSDPNFASHPIGTGPYVFDSWSRGENIVLKANPELLGRRTVDRPGHLSLHRRAGHPPLGPDGRRTGPDHQSPA